MGSAAPTNKRTTRKIGGAGSESMPVHAGRIDLIVPRVIIMEGRAQLSSRGCGAKVVQRRCLAARCMER